MNKLGEVPDCGPEWACHEYGQDGHDYQTCSACWTRFEVYMAAKASLVAAGHAPLP